MKLHLKYCPNLGFGSFPPNNKIKTLIKKIHLFVGSQEKTAPWRYAFIDRGQNYFGLGVLGCLLLFNCHNYETHLGLGGRNWEVWNGWGWILRVCNGFQVCSFCLFCPYARPILGPCKVQFMSGVCWAILPKSRFSKTGNSGTKQLRCGWIDSDAFLKKLYFKIYFIYVYINLRDMRISVYDCLQSHPMHLKLWKGRFSWCLSWLRVCGLASAWMSHKAQTCKVERLNTAFPRLCT